MELAEIAGISDDASIDRFGFFICCVAERYVVEQDERAPDLRPSTRVNFLRSRIVDPIQAFLDTLVRENDKYWSTFKTEDAIHWLDESYIANVGMPLQLTGAGKNQLKRDDSPPVERRIGTRRELLFDLLSSLKSQAELTIADIQRNDATTRDAGAKPSVVHKPNTNMVANFVYESACIYRVFSNDKAMLAKDHDRMHPPAFVEFIRKVVAPLFGPNVSVTKPLKDAKAEITKLAKEAAMKAPPNHRVVENFDLFNRSLNFQFEACAD